MLETGRKVCLRCGAWYDDYGRGLAGQPFRVMVLRYFVVLIWMVWILAAIASLTQSYLLALVAGIALVPLGAAIFALSVRAYQWRGVLFGLACMYLWGTMAFLEACFEGTSAEGLGAMGVSSMSVLILGWLSYSLYRHPVIASNPWCCHRCGYVLIGLPGNRCPECGEKFSPEQVVKSIPSHRRHQFAVRETSEKKVSG